MKVIEQIVQLKKRIESLERSITTNQEVVSNTEKNEQSESTSVICEASSDISCFDIVRLNTSKGVQSAKIFSMQGGEKYSDISIGVALEDAGNSDRIKVATGGVTYARVKVSAAGDVLAINTPLIPDKTGGFLKKSSGQAVFNSLEDAQIGADIALVKFAASGGPETKPKPFTISAADTEGCIKVEAGKIIAGLTTLSYPGVEKFAVSGNCYPTIAVSRNSGTGALTMTFSLLDTFPTQSDTIWYLTLGYVEASGSSITSITQYADGTQYIDRVC